MIAIVVDPDAAQLIQTKDCLEKDGVTAVAFCDPMAAVQYGYNHEVDAVYTEVDMPRISGFDLVRLLRKRHMDIKTYFVTGGGTQYLELANQAGLTGYYTKPLKAETNGMDLLSAEGTEY